MTNTPRGDEVIARLIAAENSLRALDPKEYRAVEQWYDKELYGALFGHSGATVLPDSHAPAIKALLRARIDVYRAQKIGDIVTFRPLTFDSEVGNEQMAQTIERALEILGEGPLPDARRAPRWDDLIPEGFL